MTPEEERQLQRAVELHRPIARAAALGRRNGLGLGIFGALSVLLSLPSRDFAGVAIGALLLTTGIIEVRSSKRLASVDPAATKILASNELALMIGIATYCVLELTVLRGSGSELESQLGDTRALGFDVGELIDAVNTQLYLVFLAVTLLYQGGMARYFQRLRPKVDAYLGECPDWARRVVAELRE